MRCLHVVRHFFLRSIANFGEHNTRGVHAAVRADKPGETGSDVSLPHGWPIDNQHGKLVRAGFERPVEVARLIKVSVLGGIAPGGDATAGVRHQQREAVDVLQQPHGQPAALGRADEDVRLLENIVDHAAANARQSAGIASEITDNARRRMAEQSRDPITSPSLPAPRSPGR